MDIVEIEQKETLGREEAAARLRAIADMLAADNDVEFEQGGMKIKSMFPTRCSSRSSSRSRPTSVSSRSS